MTNPPIAYSLIHNQQFISRMSPSLSFFCTTTRTLSRISTITYLFITTTQDIITNLQVTYFSSYVQQHRLYEESPIHFLMYNNMESPSHLCTTIQALFHIFPSLTRLCD